jgi:hypothetical protein
VRLNQDPLEQFHSETVPRPLQRARPVVRVAIRGVPSWAKRVPVVPALTVMLAATAGLSVVVALTLRV